LVPWRNHTLVGVWHRVHEGHPDRLEVEGAELQSFVDEINWAYPPADLTTSDISFVNAGLVLFGENEPGAEDLSYGKRSRIVDHSKVHGIEGLITVIGVRSTTARGVAERAVRLACRRLGLAAGPAGTHAVPLFGGDIGPFRDELDGARARYRELPEESIPRLIRNHGSEHQRVLAYADQDPELAETLDGSAVLKAQCISAVRDEMALKLTDVVFRRTELGSAGNPGRRALEQCAELVAAELDWSEERTAAEIEDVQAVFP
jgi:glycerol-3-phosphate dehydrogenase